MQLIFENPGEIDMAAVVTMGVNVKEGNAAIGQFGTGMKYAIAGVLRLGGQFTVLSGTAKFVFSLRETEIRGKQFHIVHMNDLPLGFTSDLGKHWEPWMIYRELWSNCRDEGGTGGAAGATHPVATAGRTFVIVDCTELWLAHGARDKFLLFSEGRKPLWENEDLQVFAEPSEFGFYRGIRVTQWSDPTCYTYNVLRQTALTEDRTMLQSDFSSQVQQTLASRCLDAEVLEPLLVPDENRMEAKWYWTRPYYPTSVFRQYLTELAQRRVTDLAPGLSQIGLSFVAELPVKKKEATPAEKRMLEQAEGFLRLMEIELPKIEVVESLGIGTLGLARGGKIFLPKAIFHQGLKRVISTILEEYLHARLGLRDYSRAMQDWLLERLVTEAAERHRVGLGGGVGGVGGAEPQGPQGPPATLRLLPYAPSGLTPPAFPAPLPDPSDEISF